MNFKHVLIFGALLATLPLRAAVIGTNVPAQPLTLERIATLPAAQQAAWTDYLERSQKQMQADRAFLKGELKTVATNPPSPHEVRNARGVALQNLPVWYAGTNAHHIAEVVVSFQTPAGGWSKNLDMTRSNREPGEPFAPNNNSAFIGARDFDQAIDTNWTYIGTFDNDATITQLRFLAKVATANPKNSDAFRASFLRGLDYIFNAQYPNGGWPQVWPLQGGYHDDITFNDDAMLNVLTLLRNVSIGTNDFAFVPAEARKKAGASFQRGLDCLLASQIIVNGRRTVWCQQQDELTLAPASARNYEMPSLASSESANIVLFLMQLPHPDSNVVTAVRGAAAWFDETKLMDIAFTNTPAAGRMLVHTPGKGPLWSRYYEIGSNRPIFGDRDKSIHDDVNEISRERRKGYSWFNDNPKRVLEHFRRWSKEHPA
jgi:PelA/Pel-15E family pectate lyase